MARLPRPLEQRFQDAPEILAVAIAYEEASAAWDEDALEDFHHAVEELFERGGVLQPFVIDRMVLLLRPTEPDDETDAGLEARVSAALERTARCHPDPRQRTGAVIALQSLEEGAWGAASLLWEIERRAGERIERILQGDRASRAPVH